MIKVQFGVALLLRNRKNKIHRITDPRQACMERKYIWETSFNIWVTTKSKIMRISINETDIKINKKCEMHFA